MLDNDSDGDDDPLSIIAFDQGDNGSVELVDGELVYTADANFNGADSFTYEIDDGNGNTATATVDVTVNSVNDAPILSSGDTFDFVEGDTAPVFTAEASDVDEDPITFLLHGEDAGLFDVSETGEVSFVGTPAFDDEGSNTFGFTLVASDGDLTDTQEISITLLKDSDGDIVHDGIDNATFVSNADQRDSNSDGVGNVIDGDFDGDGFVGTSDAIELIGFFGAGDPDNGLPLIDGQDAAADADFNGDGAVDVADLGAFRDLFGRELGAHAEVDSFILG